MSASSLKFLISDTAYKPDMVKPVLYHSSYCANSVRLLKMIHEEYDADLITFLDVSRQKGKPSWVKVVPLLSEDGPIKGRVWFGDKLFGMFTRQPEEQAPQEQVEPELDPHDPRARLNLGNMSMMGKQESTLPMRSSMSDTAGGFTDNIAPFNEAGLMNFSSDKALGKLSEGMTDQIDFNAPEERMMLEETEPFPVKGS